MHEGIEVDQVGPGLFVWQRYDPKLKADLSSTAVATAAGFHLIDPIPLQLETLKSTLGPVKVAGVIVTNGNHGRAAVDVAETFRVQIYAHEEARLAAGLPVGADISEGYKISGDLTVVTIKGAAPGEVAIYGDREGGTMIVGDALINFGSHGFSFLPLKYCSNAKQMRKSLRKLLDFGFERILFAHGTPILTDGRHRLAELLDEKKR
jgi:hypothetical protein